MPITALYIFRIVVTINKSATTDIYLTLTERATMANFLFVAKHRGTNEVVKFVLPANTSLYTFRYDKFSITTQFANSEVGFWDYKVYEQASPSNTDETLAGAIIEEGYMQLLATSTPYITDQYSGVNNQYKVYNG